jgi:hypothetical protein
VTDNKILRGPWGKPWITRDHQPLQWDGNRRDPSNGHLYERPSDLSGNLDTKENLSPYQQCQAVTGMMLDKSLAVQYKALVSEFGIFVWDRAKDDVKALLRDAKRAGGDEFKPNMGSGFGQYCHLRDIKADVTLPVPEFEPWLDCYEEIMAPWEVVSTEGFVVIDNLEDPGGPTDICAAGSYDRILRAKQDIFIGTGKNEKLWVPEGAVVVADIKSGSQDEQYAMKVHIQVAGYAHGVHYDQATGQRTPLHPDLLLDKGVMIHVPFQQQYKTDKPRPNGTTYGLDLIEGWRLCQMSADLTKARRMRLLVRDSLARAKREVKDESTVEGTSTSEDQDS